MKQAVAYLRCYAEHFERRWHVQVLGNANVGEVDVERLAPDANPVHVKDGQITGQRQHQCLGVVLAQRFAFAVLIGHFDAVLARPVALTHPEKGIWNTHSNTVIRICGLFPDEKRLTNPGRFHRR
jgi:hypothetical protein